MKVIKENDYSGDKNEKLLDSQIGNFLSSKLGGKYAVEQLMREEKLELMALSDSRGFDASGMRAGVYMTEAQNMSVDLMKLMLQRVGEDSYVVIDGDVETQLDLDAYSGKNNGLRRMSEVFRGQNYYGEVVLQTCHRSEIAARAELM